MKTKWEMIFGIVLVLVIGSCTAYEHHNATELRIARLECQQNNDEE